MAWNQMSDHNQRPKKTPKRLWRTIGLLCIVIFTLVVVVFFARLGSTSEEEQSSPKTSGYIEEVAPSLSTDEVPAATEAVPKELPPQKVGETRDGKILLPSGRLHVVRGIKTNDFTKATSGKYAIFNYSCENEIACMLTIEPGEGLVGTPSYNGRFKEEFLESLKEPIIIKADDSEEDKELKRNVIQAKIDLKDAMDRGEDIEQIMLDTRAEYQKLSIYKQELKSQIDELSKEEDCSTQDLEDLVEAANKLLAEKGIAPLKYGPLIKRKILMMRH